MQGDVPRALVGWAGRSPARLHTQARACTSTRAAPRSSAAMGRARAARPMRHWRLVRGVECCCRAAAASSAAATLACWPRTWGAACAAAAHRLAGAQWQALAVELRQRPLQGVVEAAGGAKLRGRAQWGEQETARHRHPAGSARAGKLPGALDGRAAERCEALRPTWPTISGPLGSSPRMCPS